MLLIACIVLGATCIYTMYAYYQRKFLFFRKLGIPGPKPIPVFGNLLDNVMHKPWMAVARKREKQFGKVYGVYDTTTPRLVVSDPDIIRKIMVQDFDHFVDRVTTRFVHPIEQMYMFVLPKHQWTQWRKLLTPAYSPAKLKAMTPVIQSATDHLIKQITAEAQISDKIDLRSICVDFGLELLAGTGLGVEIDLHIESNPGLAAIKKYMITTRMNRIMFYLLPKWLKQMTGYTIFNKEGLHGAWNYITSVVHERKRHMKDERDFEDFTQTFLSATIDDKDIPEDFVIANIIQLFVLVFDSLALLISITSFLLAQHPEIQERLLAEVRKACDSDPQKVDYECTKELPLMEAVINETLRLYPPSTYTERKVSQAYDLDGITLPHGLHVFIPICVMHYDERYFPNPNKFDPDRFMPERVHTIVPFTFLPFGDGPRNCPGIRFTMIVAKIALSRLLLRFELKPFAGGRDDISIANTMDEFLMPSDYFVTMAQRKVKTEGS